MENPDESNDPETELEHLARAASIARTAASLRPKSARRRNRAAGACALAAAIATVCSLCLLKSMNAPRWASAFSPPATLPAPSQPAPPPPVHSEFHYPHPHFADAPAQITDHPASTGELFPDAKAGK